MMKSSVSRKEGDVRAKYTAVKTSDDDHVEVKDPNSSEKSPLLENIQKLSISPTSNKTNETPDNKQAGQAISDSGNAKEKYCKSDEMIEEKEKQANGNVMNSIKDNEDKNNANPNEENSRSITDYDNEGARPKHAESRRADGSHENIDIVRKMSETQCPNYVPWQLIGTYQTLKQKRCQRLYASTGRSDDLALFFHNGKFYIMEAWCTHMGGPLFDGDIEDYNGRCHVMCPWHSYMFDLETGKNEIGLQQKVYDLKYEAGQIYVRYHTAVSTETTRKASVAQGPKVINRPPEGKHEKFRKTSVLDSPIQLTE